MDQRVEILCIKPCLVFLFDRFRLIRLLGNKERDRLDSLHPLAIWASTRLLLNIQILQLDEATQLESFINIVKPPLTNTWGSILIQMLN